MNLKIKEIEKDLEKILYAPDILYIDKLNGIADLLKKVVNNIIFSEYSDKVLENIDEITNCLDKSLCSDKSFCFLSEDDECKLIITKINLINKTDNEVIYFIRIADELIRYKRISFFILEPMAYLSFAKIKYNLNEDEIIMLQSLITQQYFENLDIIDSNKFIKNTTFDTAYPNKSKYYSNEIFIEKYLKDLEEKESEHKQEKQKIKINPKLTIKQTIPIKEEELPKESIIPEKRRNCCG